MHSKQIRVLLIEDNKGDSRLFRDLLALSNPGCYYIKEVRRLKAGLAMLNDDEFDIVLTDLGLPDSSGLNVVEHIQAHNKAIPVVVISGLEDEKIALQALQLGAQDYLVKGRGDGYLINRVINYSIERKRNEQNLNYLANYDSLTGLVNRFLFQERLDRALIRAIRNKTLVALMVIDLDRFKNINDTLGHGVGDDLLIESAKRFENCTREGDTVARLGGDEFTIIIEDIKNIEAAATISEKILSIMKKPLELSSHELYVTPSIGISIYPIDASDPESLLKNADAAMYTAKQNGRNNYCFYTKNINDRLIANLNMEAKLRKAIDKEQLILHYQPKFSVNTRKLIGVEVLVRWNDPEQGLIQPNSFIPLAEECGLISLMTDWIMEKACEQNLLWQQKGYKPFRIAINLSPKQLKQKHLMDRLILKIINSGLKPEYVELEITESALVEDVDSDNAIIKTLRDHHIHIAIDDFGTGYSSLNYLKKFPVDTLKIDQSFVHDILTDTDDAAIVSAIIAIAKSLRLNVIAEGVETEAQFESLKEKGCDEVQGYLFSKPVAADELVDLLQR